MKPSSALFISKEGMATFWAMLGGVAILGSGFYVERKMVAAGLRPQFIIMTNRDILTLDPGTDPDREREILMEQTSLAMDSVFNKTPAGLDAPDRCKTILSPDAWNWVKTELLDKQAEAFREGHLHQKVEIAEVNLHQAANREDGTIASVRGQLIRTGVLDGRLFNEVWNVRADMMWTKNTSLRTSGRIPHLCESFTCRETPVASTIRRTMPEDATTAPKSAAVNPSATSLPVPSTTSTTEDARASN